MAVSFVACFGVSVVFEYRGNLPGLAMESVVVGVCLVRDVYSDRVSFVKSLHFRILRIRLQVSVLVGFRVAITMPALSRETACWLSAHWMHLADWLPEPGVEWMERDIRVESHEMSASLLVSKGIAEKVERDADRVWSYRTNPHAYERVMSYVENSSV